MKTTVKNLAAALVIVLGIGGGPLQATNTDYSYFTRYELSEEAPLELESWMLDESYFNIGAIYFQANEESLALEPWMLREFEPIAFIEEETVEPGLEFEAWMFDDKVWETVDVVSVEDEKPLTIEPWMLKLNECFE